MPQLDRSRKAFDHARRLMPGGVNSAARAFGPVGGNPPIIASGEGPRLRDIDGNEYVDLVMSWGPLIRGHAHPEVVAALQEAAARGTSYGATTELETRMAELVEARVHSVELVRFTNSGTEATMAAIRLARGVTGHDRIVKFAGCWHGHADPFLVAAGSSALSLGQPDSPGVPAAVAEDTLTAPYNDAAAVENILRDRRVAAVIVEPVAGNMGCIPPVPGFLDGLHESCREHGVCLIFDEVITGFRVAPGGAQELYNVEADLTTMGKTIGGGLPVGAFGGRRRYMEHVAPLGMCVSQGGTLSGNPLAMTAGYHTLAPLSHDSYRKLDALGAYLADGLKADGLTVQRVGSMMTVFFTDKPVRNLAGAKRCDTARFARWHRAMLDRGVYLPPSQFEAFFVSLAHTEKDLDLVIAAHRDALKTI